MACVIAGKGFNVKILIAGYFSAFWHEGAWCRALRELGHEVIEFPIRPYFAKNLLGRLQDRFALFKCVVVAQVLANRVGQLLLFRGQFKVHFFLTDPRSFWQ